MDFRNAEEVFTFSRVGQEDLCELFGFPFSLLSIPMK
jgi:hypothetical protein